MCSTRVLALLALFMQLAHSLNWDFVVCGGKRLEFYYNGTITHTENIPAANDIKTITYDPVHYKVLFADFNYPNMLISSYDISTRQIQPLLTRRLNEFYYVRIAYEPVTQLIFWKELHAIYSFSLNSTSSYKAVDGNLLVSLDHYCADIAVDSFGGYIYWITYEEIERARFDGSEREVLINSTVRYRRSLAIDQQTQKMYWTEKRLENGEQYIESANLHGKNRTTFHVIVRNNTFGNSLAVSQDFIYWEGFDQRSNGIWQFPKVPSQHEEEKLILMSSSDCWYCHRIAANYTIQEHIQGIITNSSKPESTVSICQNYCLQGDCSISDEGQPTCSCKAGYSGERCEVIACHNYCMNSGVCSLNEEDEPVCQCTADYDGERCDVSICKDYCLQGSCSVDTEGQPKCSCKVGYSGERCEVTTCHNYCLNNGVCSLNEHEEPACQCTTDYNGEKCEVPAFLIKCSQTISMLKDMLSTDVTPVTLGKGVNSTCASTVV